MVVNQTEVVQGAQAGVGMLSQAQGFLYKLLGDSFNTQNVALTSVLVGIVLLYVGFQLDNIVSSWFSIFKYGIILVGAFLLLSGIGAFAWFGW